MTDHGYHTIRKNPLCQVIAGGAPLENELMEDLQEVCVNQFAHGPSTFSLTIDMWDAQQQDYRWQRAAGLAEGSQLVISLGFEDEGLTALIEGEVIALEPGFHERGTPTLGIYGFDRLHHFFRGKLTRSFQNQSDSQIVATLAQELGLRAEIQPTSVVHEYVLQNCLSNMAFLRQRADRIGFEVNISNGILRFRQKPVAQPPALELEYGETLRDFYPRLTTLNQNPQNQVQGWDPKTKQTIAARADSGSLLSRMAGNRYGTHITRTAFAPHAAQKVRWPVASQAEADQIAAGRLGKRALGFICGDGTAIGSPALQAGRTVQLSRLGERFSGIYYVTAASHRLNQRGYATNFYAERCAS